MAALFVVGSLSSDLFELRYFSGAVPAMLLLGARVADGDDGAPGDRRRSRPAC